MSSSATVDWKQFKDEKLFQKWVDRLSGNDFKQLINSDEDFRARIEGRPWDSTPNVRDARPVTINPESELAQMIAADQAAAEQPERELNEQITEMVEKDLAEKNRKLGSRLDSGQGLDAQLCTWLNLPKNIPVMPIPTAGFTGAGLDAIKAAACAFMAKHEKEGRFNQDEQLMLMKTMTDACNVIGRMFNPRSVTSWEAVYKICLMAGRIRPQGTQPEPKPEPVPQTLPKGLDESARRKQYTTEVVFHSRRLNRDLTRSDIAGLLGDDYATIIREGYKADGELLLNTDQLRPGRAR